MIYAPKYKYLNIMKLCDLKLDSTRSYMVDVHGRKYDIKNQRGRYYIQHAKGQLTVTSLVNSKPEGDYVFNYIFGGQYVDYPCPAMDFWIYRHRLAHKITIQNYISKFKIKKR
jgi:hypothetical protein